MPKKKAEIIPGDVSRFMAISSGLIMYLRNETLDTLAISFTILRSMTFAR